MAYPFGAPKRHFTSETIEIAKEVGYQYGASVTFRGVRFSENPLSIPRFFVARDPLHILKSKILGAWDLIGIWQEKTPTWLAKIVSPHTFKY